jgi:ABC-2 type transport system ATP-binding protein
MKPIITAVELTKTYGKSQALINLSLNIYPGSIYGLIGPNGAGKTTTLAILAGLIRPTSGTAWMLGQEVQTGSNLLASRVGFSSPQFPLFDYLTGMEVLSACGQMHGLASREVRKRSRDLLELMDLQSSAGQYICNYSQGMRQKLSLACALIHAPEVILLDEPFLGLDPAAIYQLVCLFGQMAAGGRTLLISSHHMALVERLCNGVGILHQGILQREMPLTAKGLEADSSSRLESALWEIVGTPVFKELTWI